MGDMGGGKVGNGMGGEMEGMGCCRDDLGGWRVGMEGRW